MPFAAYDPLKQRWKMKGSSVETKMQSHEVLETARKRFAAGMWRTDGWGSGDRRCIVGTLRDITGQSVSNATAEKKNPPKSGWDREPYFTAYEEVIFACVSIIDSGFNAVEKYKENKKHSNQYTGSGFGASHAAILTTLDQAEAQLISYNDRQCGSAEEMIRLMEQATLIVKEQRQARQEEWSGGGSSQSIMAAAMAAGTKAVNVVIASDEDGKAAEEEYKQMRKENPDLPPIWSFFSSKVGKKRRRKAKQAVLTRDDGERIMHDRQTLSV